MNSTLDIVCEVAAQVFGLPDGGITEDSSPDTVGEWDSTRQLFLVLALEERFGVQLAPEEIEKLTNIGEIANALERTLANAANRVS